MLQHCFVLLAILSLPGLALSIKRFVGERSPLAFGLALWATVLTATFISASFHHEGFMSIVNMGQIALEIDISMTMAAGALFLAGFVATATTAVFVRYVKASNFWKWTVALMGFFLLCNLCAAIAGAWLSGKPVELCFFGACCGSMGIAGVAWGLTYKEICVIVNIYLQGGICLLSALWLTWNSIRAYRNRPSASNLIIMLFGVGIAILYSATFIWLCVHYSLPLTEAYNLCYRELKQLAQTYSTTYNNANYAIFIIGFLAVVVSNLTIGTLIRRRRVDSNRFLTVKPTI